MASATHTDTGKAKAGVPAPQNANGVDHNLGLELGYLPPDQRPAHLPSEILTQLEPNLDEDTEAAEALRANANVKVGKVGKVARSIHAQTVRRMVKRATLRGKSGTARGKPPRIPPGQTDHVDEDSDIYVLKEEPSQEEHDDEVSMQSSLDSSTMRHEDSEFVSPGSPQKKKVIFDRSFREDPMYATIAPPLETARLGSDTKDIPADVYKGTVEAGKKFLGTVDPHNLLKLNRWRKKKKSGSKKDRKSYVKGKVIDGRHELYTLSIAVMLGVRTSITKTNGAITSADQRRMLVPQDFMTEEKYEFAPKGSETTPPHKLSHTFKFKDYAPLAFAYIRRMFGVNEFDFLLSVCGNANFIEFISNAKSGQFFFYSSDGKYMIKTMTNAESKFLRRILPHYFKHCTQNPNTLLPKFFGMYRVKLYHLRRNVKFVIMNSVYYTDKYLQSFYDLKGSVLGRAARPGQDVLKDNDLRAKLPEESLALKKEQRERVRAQVVSDCSFLRMMQIMDYSMLVGVHHIPARLAGPKGSIAKTGFRSGRKRRSSRTKEGNFAKNPDNVDDSSVASSTGHISETDQSESTRKLIKDLRDSDLAHVGNDLEVLFDEDDDNSYLDSGPASNPQRRVSGKSPNFDDIEVKKEHTIEQIYWPFHRFYDINGLRRMKPRPCYRCNHSPCDCEGHSEVLRAWKIPEFVEPLSNRKDGGFEMDTAGVDMPRKFVTANGAEKLYEGKIFYMGIIDILQQYTVRKRAETGYRKVEGYDEPSCVHPDEYADRFVKFFDEYSAPCKPERKWKKTVEETEKTEIELSQAQDRNVHVSVNSSARDE